jgi:putative two-component system response regulator
MLRTEAPSLQGRIMVVDDDPASLRLIEGILQPPRYEVRSFSSGRTALTDAGERPPDLILLDITMPEMTGYEVCERLKSNARLSRIPVIFLSALNSPEDRLRGLRSGVVDYVAKPFRWEEMRARVDTHLRLGSLQQKSETDNCLLRELARLQSKQIASAHVETIFAIAKLAEARDDETGRHVERVQTFCKLIATGLSELPQYETTVNSSWIEKLYHASPLHDIGKAAIPDRILLKCGPLTPGELAIMKTHAARGARILRTLHERYPGNEFIEMGIKVARSHHERWDGTGYPDGLAGNEIPLCARILAVSDCYDGIRSRRCYKPTTPHDETCAIILEESGKHFDPAVVTVFSKLADTFRDIWQQLPPKLLEELGVTLRDGRKQVIGQVISQPGDVANDQLAVTRYRVAVNNQYDAMLKYVEGKC